MKVLILLVFILGSLLATSYGEKDYFKVPLEIRETNRPERLVDNTDDPDMIRMKKLQDKFFTIVANSSMGQDFKSFTQLLQLLDSDVGLELGRLTVNGFMIGAAKENSAQLFMEFIDDFKYRLTPDLADALIDYSEFLKTVDLKLMPLTIQTLFRKDELGNSLAQIPLGQLVDLIQPEASKYGIDIRSMINGIIGKGDKTFPQIVKKIMTNFNASKILKGLTESVMTADETPTKEDNKSTDKSIKKRPKKDTTLMLFKPMIAKLLKDYQVDLEVDAVIQVLTPFVAGWGQMISKMFSKDGEEGGGFNVAQLAPLLALLTAQNGGEKNNAANMMQAAMAFMGNIADQDGGMAPLLNMASQLIGGPNADKSPKDKKLNKNALDLEGIAGMISQLGAGGQGMDANNVMQMASSLLTNKIDSGGLDAKSMLQMASSLMGDKKNGGPDAADLLKAASKLVGSLTKDSKLEKSKKLKGIFEVLAPFLKKLQKDKKMDSKIRDAVMFAKVMIGSKLPSMESLKKTLPELLASSTAQGMAYQNIDVDAIFAALAFDLDDWSLFINELADNDFREMLLRNAMTPATDVIEMIATDEFQERQKTIFKGKWDDTFSMMGLDGDDLTIPKALDALKPSMDMMSAGWNLPVKVTSLVEPLKRSWIETTEWYYESVAIVKKMSRKDLETLVSKSMENDFAFPILDVAKIASNSETSSRCIAREVCELVNDVGTSHPDSVKLLITRISSIVYAAIRSEVEQNYNIILEVMKATSIAKNCEKHFPIACPTVIEAQQEDDSKMSTKTEPSHEEL